MKKVHQVIERSKECLSPLGKIESRTQFGGYTLAVEKVVFALVNEDELYLRASEALREYVIERPLEPLIFRKRGLPVSLNYFKVDEALWQNAEHLLALSASALQAAQGELLTRHVSLRLKDLPNLSLRIEMLLREAGICTVKHLREMGAKQCWLKLKAINKHVGLNTLLALQGAISGHHHAALPPAVRAELSEWYKDTVKR
ncbi:MULTISPECIES: TfoX/Sxy family DNA transformation protein [unclassified Pantoea]|jgi:DNA transformation protein|uniref:TfoX/Sxy family DNA transformation protein n=1 Tax=Pantoea TaxID=53335 RepID=UPI001FA9785F|nr:TfoX/Sxy family DNA transformation protein [Pantoea sp. MQR6]